MASTPLKSPHLELWGEFSIPKPEPLRIIKERTKTVTCCDTSKRVSVPRRGLSGSIYAHGSPPQGPHSSLAISKKRRARGFTLDGSFGSDGSSFSSIETPAATYIGAYTRIDVASSATIHKSTRTTSVGSFIKSELFRRSSEMENAVTRSLPMRKLSKSNRKSISSSDVDLFSPPNGADQSKGPSGLHTENSRRDEKGSKLMSKAFSSVRSKSMHFLPQKPSKGSLLRHVSLKNHQASIKVPSDIPPLNMSRFSFEPDSADIADLRYNIKMPSGESEATLSQSYILSPEITVVPEVDSVDARGESTLWVAVIVTGTLREAGTSTVKPAELLRENGCSRVNENLLDGIDYGYLCSLDIKLVGRSDCTLEAVIPDLNTPRTIRPGQTELILARVKLPAAVMASSHIRESSSELIDELESRLGNKVTTYLCVTVSYRHSAFPTVKGLAAGAMGVSYHTTSMKTEAHAIIKRHYSQSEWAIGGERSFTENSMSDLLDQIINAHYDPDRARDIVDKIASDGSPSDLFEPRHCSNHSLDSTCRTVIQTSRNVSGNSGFEADGTEDEDPSNSIQAFPEVVRAKATYGTDLDSRHASPEKSISPDPARKIWSEMRKNSRGVSDSPRSGTLSFESRTEEVSDLESDLEAIIQQEKARIMEMVIRNKRSVGADTLRSMVAPAATSVKAPNSVSLRTSTLASIGGSVVMGDASKVTNSLAFGGMQTKRGWGWGPPWW